MNVKKLRGYNYVGEKITIDSYYYDPLRKNLQLDGNMQLNECFRLRTRGNKNYITYKVDNFDENKIWIYSDEYETEVSNMEQLKKLLICLD